LSGVGVRADFDLGAATSSANFKTCAIVRERIRPRIVDKIDCDQKLWRFFRAVIYVTDGLKIDLVPMVWSIVGRKLSFIKIFNSIAEGISRFSQAPSEDAVRIVGIAHNSGVRSTRAGVPIETFQTIAASHLPVIVLGGTKAFDSGEDAFGPRPIEHGAV